MVSVRPEQAHVIAGVFVTAFRRRMLQSGSIEGSAFSLRHAVRDTALNVYDAD